MIKEWRINSIDQLEDVASELLNFAYAFRIFLIHGEMGAGKTTFVKALVKVLGSIDEVTSPTYGLVHHYMTVKNNNIYHFDFYRVETADEILDIGFEEYFFSGDICLVEWPEKIEQLLNFNKADIFITVENDQRKIVCRYD